MIPGIPFSVDGILADNLERAKEAVKLNWDMIAVVDGVEGSGKTTLAFQLAYYTDNRFNLSSVVFTPKQLTTAIDISSPGESIVYDESYTGFFGKDVNTIVTKNLVKKMSVIRKKRLFIYLVMPSVFELEKYMAIHRTRYLIHVGYKDYADRGYFYFYNYERKKDLYLKGKKYYSYSEPAPNFYGRFTKYFPIDDDQYQAKKDKSLAEMDGDKDVNEASEEAKEVMWQRCLAMPPNITHELKMNMLGLSKAQYYYKLKKEVEKAQST